MAPPMYVGCRQVLLFSVLLLLFVSVCFSDYSEPQFERSRSRRRMLELDEEYEQPVKKKSTKNQTKLASNNNLSSKNQTKTIKFNNLDSSKNQTKLPKITDTNGVKIKKLNSTNTLKTKKLNSTSKALPNSSKTSTSSSSSLSSNPTKKSLDLEKAIGTNSKNKTTKATATKDKDKQTSNKTKKLDQSDEKEHENEEFESEKNKNKKISKTQNQNNKDSTPQQGKKPKSQPNSIFNQEDDDDLIFSEFKDLPMKFQKTIIPDIERISTTSRAYILKTNKEITKGFKPYVGNKYAPTIATLLSCSFILIPFVFVSLLFNKIKAYFSLQKLLIFIQAYLSIYFSILCLSSLVTGLEPLRFFYSTSRNTYLCLQVLQTLAYVFYLLLLVMYVILVFSTECGMGSRVLGLAQTFVGFAVGLHYYMTVFHRVVLRQPPKTSWKIHGIYATCFFLICLMARMERRKKTYLEEGGEEGKKN